ncbi:MAG: hypothetical protein ACRDVZ_00340 [Jiangellaceae bacterium]
MIPTLIVFGLIFGRWWRSSLVVGTLMWPVLLLATDTVSSGAETVSAAGLALLNTGVGVLTHQAVSKLVRLARRRTHVDVLK